jgi:ProP effector
VSELAEKIAEATNAPWSDNPAACGPDRVIEVTAQSVAPVVGKRKQRLLQTIATIALLAERYPRTFFVLGKQRKPLKIGIADDIMADGAIDSENLRWALGVYCNSPDYLRSFQAGAVRLDLAGNEAGIVTEAEADHARVKLAAVLARRQPQPSPRQRFSNAGKDQRLRKRKWPALATRQIRSHAKPRPSPNNPAGRPGAVRQVYANSGRSR